MPQTAQTLKAQARSGFGSSSSVVDAGSSWRNGHDMSWWLPLRQASSNKNWALEMSPIFGYPKTSGVEGQSGWIGTSHNQVGHKLPSWIRSSGTGVVGTVVTSGSSPLSQIAGWDRISLSNDFNQKSGFNIEHGTTYGPLQKEHQCGQVAIWILALRKQIMQRILCLRTGLMVPLQRIQAASFFSGHDPCLGKFNL